jgi:hypothetical protein
MKYSTTSAYSLTGPLRRQVTLYLVVRQLLSSDPILRRSCANYNVPIDAPARSIYAESPICGAR